MATPATPAPSPIALTVMDPLSADAKMILDAYTATMNLYATPAGQKLLEAELTLAGEIETAISNTVAKGWNAIVALFKGKK